MQDKNRRAPYTGRFASTGANPGSARTGASDARAHRASAPSRSGGAQASAGARPQRRPSGFAIPETEKRPAPRASEAAEKDDSKAKAKPGRFRQLLRRRKEKKGDKSPAKRSQVRKLSWKQKLLIILGALLALALLLVLIFGRGDGNYHQLPRIERGGDSAYEPEQSAGTEGGEAGETGETEYLVNPGEAPADGGSGEVDWSQYLVTPEPGADLSQAAAAAGASLDAAGGEAGA